MPQFNSFFDQVVLNGGCVYGKGESYCRAATLEGRAFCPRHAWQVDNDTSDAKREITQRTERIAAHIRSKRRAA